MGNRSRTPERVLAYLLETAIKIRIKAKENDNKTHDEEREAVPVQRACEVCLYAARAIDSVPADGDEDEDFEDNLCV